MRDEPTVVGDRVAALKEPSHLNAIRELRVLSWDREHWPLESNQL